MEFLVGRVNRTLVTCVAEPKSGSQEVCTRSNPDLMECKIFRREGGNGLTLRNFFIFLFELLISTLLSGGMGLFFASSTVFLRR